MSCRRRGALMSQAMEQENDDVPQDGHRLRRRSLADPAGILAERPIAHAVQAVLDPPVAAGQPQEPLAPTCSCGKLVIPSTTSVSTFSPVRRSRVRR